MSLGKQLSERLRLLAKEGPEAAQLHSVDEGYKNLVVERGEQLARLDIFDHDRYSVTLRGLEVAGTDPANRAPADVQTQLSSHAAEIARHLSYLEEPLAIWELDGDEQRVQLRSFPPQRDETEVLYWEVTLWSGAQTGARLARYRWAPGMIERELVAYPAAFSLIARIADSLDAALNG